MYRKIILILILMLLISSCNIEHHGTSNTLLSDETNLSNSNFEEKNEVLVSPFYELFDDASLINENEFNIEYIDWLSNNEVLVIQYGLGKERILLANIEKGRLILLFEKEKEFYGTYSMQESINEWIIFVGKDVYTISKGDYKTENVFSSNQVMMNLSSVGNYVYREDTSNYIKNIFTQETYSIPLTGTYDCSENCWSYDGHYVLLCQVDPYVSPVLFEYVIFDTVEREIVYKTKHRYNTSKNYIWSVQSNTIYFLSKDNNGIKIEKVNLDNKNNLLCNVEIDNLELICITDSDKLYLLNNENHLIYVFDGTIIDRQISPSLEDKSSFCFSPDGTKIITISKKNEINFGTINY